MKNKLKERLIKNACISCLLLTSIFHMTGCGTTPPHKTLPIKTTDTTTKNLPSDASTELSEIQRLQYKQAIEKINDGQLDIAKRTLKQLQKSSPTDDGILANLAVIAYQQENNTIAQELIDESLKISNKNPLAHNMQGLLALNNGNIKNAEKAFLEAIKFDEKYGPAYYNLALLYDTYYQDLKTAIGLYQTYLVLTGFTDKETANWVKELELSLAKEALK